MEVQWTDEMMIAQDAVRNMTREANRLYAALCLWDKPPAGRVCPLTEEQRQEALVNWRRVSGAIQELRVLTGIEKPLNEAEIAAGRAFVAAMEAARS